MIRPAHLAVVLLCVTAAACVRTQARAPAPAVALMTPPPPPRMKIPVNLEPPDSPPPAAIDEPATASPPIRTSPPPKPAPPPSSSSSSPPPVPPTTPAADTPPPVLQPSNASDLERSARTLLETAERNLSGVSFNALSRGGRDQFNNAQRFVRQAREAMTAKNFLFAKQLADKAATLARLLLKG